MLKANICKIVLIASIIFIVGTIGAIDVGTVSFKDGVIRILISSAIATVFGLLYRHECKRHPEKDCEDEIDG